MCDTDQTGWGNEGLINLLFSFSKLTFLINSYLLRFLFISLQYNIVYNYFTRLVL